MDNVDVVFLVYLYGLILMVGGLAVLFTYLYGKVER